MPRLKRRAHALREIQTLAQMQEWALIATDEELLAGSDRKAHDSSGVDGIRLGPERIGGKRVLQLRETLVSDPMPAPNAPEIDFERLFDALKLTSDERKALESTLEHSLPEAAKSLGWTNAKLRNSLDRARRRVAKGDLKGQEAQFVRFSDASRRSLNPVYESRSKTGASTWNLTPLSEDDFASVMRAEFLQVTQTKASA